MRIELFDFIGTAVTICLQIAITLIGNRMLGLPFWFALLIGMIGGFLVIWIVVGTITWLYRDRGRDS